jgi:Contractile injection system tape measure protein
LLHLSFDGQKIMADVLAKLPDFEGSAIDKRFFVAHLWDSVFSAVAYEQPLSAQNLITETLRTLPIAIVNDPVLITWLADSPFNIPKAILLDKPELQILDRLDLPKEQQKANKQAKTTESTVTDTDEWYEGIFIDCAGLVLLHPFLPQFFNALGIATEDTLLQPDRAVCLLHYLATGQTIAPEYELILAKVLCNIPLETPVESDVLLTTNEQEEAIAVLEAVVDHWAALGNTSADGLRGTFLVRSGKISLRADGDWLLQVETKSFDILLEQLPWGIGMIKLPWMERMLWVEWNS